MPSDRRHRGKHPRDEGLFKPAQHRKLRSAVRDVSWLYTRGYSENATLKLVGDRYNLTARQRKAVSRCACSDTARDTRVARRVSLPALAGKPLRVDGLNVLITVESVMSDGFVFVGRDTAHRDLASVHGTYRMVLETDGALTAIGAALARAGVGPVTWYLDRPVSNSGRLRTLMTQVAAARGWPWEVHLVNNPDRVLADGEGTVATSDAWILDHCHSWVDLVRELCARPVPETSLALTPMWLVDLSDV